MTKLNGNAEDSSGVGADSRLEKKGHGTERSGAKEEKKSSFMSKCLCGWFVTLI